MLSLVAVALAAAALGPAAAEPARLLAAGDIASCRSSGDEATARLASRLPGTIAALGDTVYEHGTDEEYRRCYAPSWGALKDRTRPAVGNHEYGTPGAAGYFRYFGRRAGPPRGYHAYRLGAWLVVVLNTNCRPAGGCGAGSPQERWLRARLDAFPGRCVVAYGHHPRWSSGIHGSDRTIEGLWRALADNGVELFLAGHDHHYERFAPRDGVRQFVAGTGGRSHYPVLRRLPGSEALDWRRFGLLALDLHEDRYAWRFVDTSGRVRDAGSAPCV